MPSLDEISELFKVAQKGSMSVVKGEGMTLEGLMSSMFFSSLWCVIQLVAYYYLRGVYPEFYGESTNINVTSFLFSQLRKKTDIVQLMDVERYRVHGPELYFLLRYIYSVIYYFVGLILICIPILVPYNWSYRGSRKGLDALSLGELGNVHILVAILILMWTEYVVRSEDAFKQELAKKIANQWGDTHVVISGDVDKITADVIMLVGMGAIHKIKKVKETNSDIEWVVNEIYKYNLEIETLRYENVQTWMYKPIWKHFVIQGLSTRVYRGAYLISEYERLEKQSTNALSYGIIEFKTRQQAEMVSKHWNVPISSKIPLGYKQGTFIWHWAPPILATILTVCWVVPVACVAILAQGPFLGKWIPGGKWMHWTESLPMAAFAQWVLPTIVLSCLTGAAIGMLEKLAGGVANVERIQKWVFRFMLFQLGLVVSVSAGAVGTLRGFLISPAGVAGTIAEDVTRAGTFFAGFFAMRGLALVGNNMLRPGSLICHIWNNRKSKNNRTITVKTTNSKPNQSPTPPLPPTSPQATMAAHAAVGILYTFVAPCTGMFVLLHFVCAWTAYAHQSHRPPADNCAGRNLGYTPYTATTGLRTGAWAVAAVVVLLLIAQVP